MQQRLNLDAEPIFTNNDNTTSIYLEEQLGEWLGLLDSTTLVVLEAIVSHISNCRFKKANDYLITSQKTPIRWR